MIQHIHWHSSKVSAHCTLALPSWILAISLNMPHWANNEVWGHHKENCIGHWHLQRWRSGRGLTSRLVPHTVCVCYQVLLYWEGKYPCKKLPVWTIYIWLRSCFSCCKGVGHMSQPCWKMIHTMKSWKIPVLNQMYTMQKIIWVYI